MPLQHYVKTRRKERAVHRACQHQGDGPHEAQRVLVQRFKKKKKSKYRKGCNTCVGSHSQCSEMGSRMMDTEGKDAVPRRHVTLTGSRGRLSGPVSPDCTDLFLFPRPHEYLSSSVVKTNLMRYRRSRRPSFLEEFTASSHCLLVMQTGQLFSSCLLPWKKENIFSLPPEPASQQPSDLHFKGKRAFKARGSADNEPGTEEHQ